MLTNARAVAVLMKDGKGETFRLHGAMGGERCRLALGTQRKAGAHRLVHKIETAFAEGVSSTLWPELQERLPRITFQALAEHIGWREPQLEPEIKPTWEQLRTRYDAHLLKEITKGNLSESTRTRYLQTIKFFDGYVSQIKKIPNGSITPSTSQPTFCQCGAFDVSPIKYSTVNITTHNAEAKNRLVTSGEIIQSSLINALGSTLWKTELTPGPLLH